MFEALGYFVEKLIRVRIGSVSLGPLPQGELRPLSRDEIQSLKSEVGIERSGHHSSERGRLKKKRAVS
jgi:16S rRNA U516 pseudouridylate synthase RsuA-like enzyme